MRRTAALLAVGAMLAGTAFALVASLPWLALVCAAGIVAVRERRAFLILLGASLAVNVVILGLAVRPDGWMLGLTGGMRLSAALAVNLAILSRVGAPRIVEGLRLPPRATALLAAIVLAAHDVGRDLQRLVDARKLEGAWPAGRIDRAREGARLVPALVLAAHRRSETRRDALHLAGHAMPAWFVPFVAVAALSAAGRMAFLALPNVALTYVVAFLGGVLFGPRIGAAGAFVGMAITDLLLTGLYPAGFVNAPAMGMLGLLGGAFRRVKIDPALSGAIGIVSVFVFSVAADSLTWLLVYRDAAAWAPIVLAGLAFNAIPAILNGAIFAASVGPTVRAFAAFREGAPRAPATAATASGATLPAR